MKRKESLHYKNINITTNRYTLLVEYGNSSKYNNSKWNNMLDVLKNTENDFMGTQSESKAKTRETLLSAFWSLYEKKNIDKITIREITQLAGYNRGTFYDYFIDIYDALDQLQNNLLDYTRVAMEQYKKDGLSNEIIKYLTDTFYARKDYFRLFLGENRDPNFHNKMKAVMRPFFFELWGVSENNESAVHIFEFLFPAIINCLSYWYKNEEIMPYDEFVARTQSMAINGAFSELQKISNTPNSYLSFIEELAKSHKNI